MAVRNWLLTLWAICACLTASSMSNAAPSESCTPACYQLKEKVTIRLTPYNEFSFRLLAVGCKEALGESWPPGHEDVEQALLPLFMERHPLEILLQAREGSQEFKAPIIEALNDEIFSKRIVYDVFIYEGQAVEY